MSKKYDEHLYNVLNLPSNNNIIESSVTRNEQSDVLVKIKFEKPISLELYKQIEEQNVVDFVTCGGKRSVTTYVLYEDQNIMQSDALNYLNEAINRASTKRQRLKSLLGLHVSFRHNIYTFIVDDECMYLKDDAKYINEELIYFGINACLEFYTNSSLETRKDRVDEIVKESYKQYLEVKDEPMSSPEKPNFYKRAPKIEGNTLPLTNIKDIPYDQGGLLTYIETHNNSNFKIRGEIFKLDINKPKNQYLVKASIYDGTDSIVVTKFVKDNSEELNEVLKWGTGQILEVIGRANYSRFDRDVVVEAQSINNLGMPEKPKREDKAEVKRVELQAHTKMSGTMDGLSDASEYIKQASLWGMNAMGFTDTSGVFEFSEILHSMPKDSNFKPIYGLEMAYVDYKNHKINLKDEDIDLREATYTVFDLETTGLSQTYDTIIEFSCIKVRKGEVIGHFDKFVNPGYHIDERITALTSITDEMVKDADPLSVVLPEFLEFAKGTILVGHNVQFDYGMICAKERELNITPFQDFAALDTLNLFRSCYNVDVLGSDGTKTFNLKALSKFFKVRQEHHHRAIDDTRVTEECFIQMLQNVYKRGVYNYKDLNSLIDESNFFKHVIPSTINILVKNQAGLKNLYKLFSDSMTIHCANDGRLMSNILSRFREGLIVFEGGYRSNVFEWALRRSEEEVRNEIKLLDFVAVQPPSSYAHLIADMPDGENRIKETIKKIIRIAKEENKLVCATSNSYYVDPSMKPYREILISSPQVGGGQNNLANYLEDYNVSPDAHLRTTDEMIDEFSFLEDDNLVYEIVVTNTNKIADLIESIQLFPKDNKETGEEAMKAPRDDQFSESLGVPSLVEDMKRIVNYNLDRLYGHDYIHPIVTKRLNRELTSIIGAGYSSTYYMAHLLVKKSEEDGYMVGSRGSVGSSFAATLMDITEINPLPPHYRCTKCKYHVFKMTDEEKEEYGIRDIDKPFMMSLDNTLSGYDLPDAVCPCCGTQLKKDGHDIPFETFLGFNGDKVPDIDLNFSSEYQAKAHAYIKEVFGVSHSFRAGTRQDIQEKNAYGYVKAYCEKKCLHLRDCEIDRLASHITGVRRSTGQHPGGIVVVPKYFDIFQVTPVQYPANKTDNAWMTTHFEYHSFEDNLLKLDCLGHDDPTLIRYYMDYVNSHQDKYPFSNAKDIPIDDANVYKMFGETEILNITKEEIDSQVASFAVPEFGTTFVRRMLNDTLPKTFAQLVKISGLSHGTNVWTTNAQDLVLGKTEFGEIPFADVIGCRDDIMLDLIKMGCEPNVSFKIMEFVRKNQKKKKPADWINYQKYMREHNVPEWYIWSCDKTEYLFPKAHATAYVLMALRIAWFKLYSPALFYSGWFSKRAKQWDVLNFPKSVEDITNRIKEIQNSPSKTDKDDDVITALEVAREARARGIKFLPVDINKSSALIFDVVDDTTLRMPFVAVDGLGEAAALSIENARKEKEFSSIEDVSKRTKLSKTLIEEFKRMGSFGNLKEKDEVKLGGLFDFF